MKKFGWKYGLADSGMLLGMLAGMIGAMSGWGMPEEMTVRWLAALVLFLAFLIYSRIVRLEQNLKE